MRELLITAEFSEASIEKLREAAGPNFHVEVLAPDSEPMMRYVAFRTAEVIIGEPNEEELELAAGLRWLQLTWAGADRYIKNPNFPAGVVLTNASGAFGVTVSEHILAGVLTLCRHLTAYRTYQFRTVARPAGKEKLLFGGTALIFGTGDIGTQTAKRLKAFGMKVIGVFRSRRPQSEDFDRLITMAEADRFLPLADLVVGCVPETKQTMRYFDRERLLQMKEDAILVNVGRGSFVVTEDLAELLQKGHLFGAVLDVTDPEPLPPDHTLRHLRNVILTPHVAGPSFGAEETEKKITAICCDNLRRYNSAWPLRNQVDFATGYRRRG